MAKGAGLDERGAIALLTALLAKGGKGRVRVGIGDDAAVLDVGGERVVWTVDAAVEGVHFERGLLTLADVGYRSFAAAVSDLGAMGARPLAALSALVLPRGITRRELSALARGQAQAAAELSCPVVGGNIARGAQISVTTSVLGVSAAPLLRSGARAGDQVWLVGPVGLSRAGLALARGRAARAANLPAASRAECLAAFRRPMARWRQGLKLVGAARAAIDVSDGLAGDAGHLARDSGVRVILEEAALCAILPRALNDVARALGHDALTLALEGGEDFALLATGPKARRPRFARAIGRVVRGRGVMLQTRDGALRPLTGGYDHLK